MEPIRIGVRLAAGLVSCLGRNVTVTPPWYGGARHEHVETPSVDHRAEGRDLAPAVRGEGASLAAVRGAGPAAERVLPMAAAGVRQPGRGVDHAAAAGAEPAGEGAGRAE